MHRERITLKVEVDLDPVPGTFNTPESAHEQVQAILTSMIPHYKPTVSITSAEE